MGVMNRMSKDYEALWFLINQGDKVLGTVKRHDFPEHRSPVIIKMVNGDCSIGHPGVGYYNSFAKHENNEIQARKEFIWACKENDLEFVQVIEDRGSMEDLSSVLHLSARFYALILMIAFLILAVVYKARGQCAWDHCTTAIDLTAPLSNQACAQLNSNLCELTEPFMEVVPFDPDGDFCGAYNRVWWASFTVNSGDPVVLTEVHIEIDPLQFTSEVEARLFQGPCSEVYASPSTQLLDCSGIVSSYDITLYLPDGEYFIAVDGVDISQGVFEVCVTQNFWVLGLGISEPVTHDPKSDFLLRWLRGEIPIDASGRYTR